MVKEDGIADKIDCDRGAKDGAPWQRERHPQSPVGLLWHRALGPAGAQGPGVQVKPVHLNLLNVSATPTT